MQQPMYAPFPYGSPLAFGNVGSPPARYANTQQQPHYAQPRGTGAPSHGQQGQHQGLAKPDGLLTSSSSSSGSGTQRSSLLEDFRKKSSKKFEFKDVVGHFVEFRYD